MTVGELRQKLADLPEHLVVVLANNEDSLLHHLGESFVRGFANVYERPPLGMMDRAVEVIYPVGQPAFDFDTPKGLLEVLILE